jgi:hypothetical protein
LPKITNVGRDFVSRIFNPLEKKNVQAFDQMVHITPLAVFLTGLISIYPPDPDKPMNVIEHPEKLGTSGGADLHFQHILCRLDYFIGIYAGFHQLSIAAVMSYKSPRRTE